jgi:hypothetical protein
MNYARTKQGRIVSDGFPAPECIVAFAKHLWEPQTHDDGKQNYNCTLLWAKAIDLSALRKICVDACVKDWGEKAVEQIKDGTIKNPFLDGDGRQAVNKKTDERHPGFAGTWFLRVSSGVDHQPKIVDRNVRPVIDRDRLPSGSRIIPFINAYTWESKQGKGVSFGISGVQIVKTAEGDEILGGGGGPAADQMFEKIEASDEDKNDAVTSADELFG